jgi:hypothetical protein
MFGEVSLILKMPVRMFLIIMISVRDLLYPKDYKRERLMTGTMS